MSSSFDLPSGLITALSKSNSTSAAKVTFSATGFGFSGAASALRRARLGLRRRRRFRRGHGCRRGCGFFRLGRAAGRDRQADEQHE
jgi:hypothetical protein